MAEAAAQPTGKTQKFKAEVSQVLSLVINSLYSNKDIFLRELISNAADALDKLRFEAIAKPKLAPEGYAPRIRLIPDREAGTLTIWDNGVGMSESALSKDLGTVARSGTREFAEKLAQAQAKAKTSEESANLIGQFGVGFYSGYLVANEIEVVSRAAGSAKASRWRSDGKESFTVEPAERDEAGTSVILHLGDDHKDYLQEWKLRELVRQYSDFISHPIELFVERKAEKPDGDKTEGDKAGDKPGGHEEAEQPGRFEVINQASALWTRPKSEISDEQYDEFYKHLTHDWEAPAARSHFKVEGTQMFTGLLFVPKNPPFDMLGPEHKHGVRLYVRRVFIMDDCDELLPRWLRFVRGVIDSDDLPLNVSRELLQDSVTVRTIRKQVIRRALEMLAGLADKQEGDYLAFWRKFGSVLKEGLHFDPSYKDKLTPLLRYESSRGDALVSLKQYLEKMPEAQDKIYYAIGPSRQMLDNSPHLEGLKQRGYEILYMTDGVDQWAVEGLGEYEGKALCNAMEADLSLGDAEKKADGEDSEKAEEGSKQESKAELEPLLSACKVILEEHVSEVRVSERLTDSPACLVLPKGGLPAHLERLIRSYQQDLPQQKRILELNPSHPLVAHLKAEHAKDPKSDTLKEWVEMLYDQALLSEGSPLPDPARFASRVASLMQRAAGPG